MAKARYLFGLAATADDREIVVHAMVIQTVSTL